MGVCDILPAVNFWRNLIGQIRPSLEPTTKDTWDLIVIENQTQLLHEDWMKSDRCWEEESDEWFDYFRNSTEFLFDYIQKISYFRVMTFILNFNFHDNSPLVREKPQTEL